MAASGWGARSLLGSEIQRGLPGRRSEKDAEGVPGVGLRGVRQRLAVGEGPGNRCGEAPAGEAGVGPRVVVVVLGVGVAAGLRGGLVVELVCVSMVDRVVVAVDGLPPVVDGLLADGHGNVAVVVDGLLPAGGGRPAVAAARGVVEAAAQELPGGREPVVRLEAFQGALHDVHQEAYGDAAVFGLLADDLGQLAGYGNRGLAPGSRRVATAVLGVLVDEVLGAGEAEVDELTGGADPVGGPGALELAFHGPYEEADDASAAVGLLAHDFLYFLYFLYMRSTLAFGVFLLVLMQVSVGVGCREHMSLL